MKIFKKHDLKYYLSGESPELLVLSGTHGDEYESIPAVKKCLDKYRKNLPAYLYIPVVSPSAVKLRTRKNKAGMDLNRTFFDDSKEPETKDIMEIVSKFKFNLCITFHEDVGRKEFYLYDSGGVAKTDWQRFKKSLKNLGVDMLNEVDDPTDPILGSEFEDGYKAFPADGADGEGDGTFWSWAVGKGLVKEIMTPEIPGKASPEMKAKVTNAFFREIIIPFVNKN